MYVTESTFSGGHRCHTKNSTKIAGFKVDHANEEGFHQLQQTFFSGKSYLKKSVLSCTVIHSHLKAPAASP